MWNVLTEIARMKVKSIPFGTNLVLGSMRGTLKKGDYLDVIRIFTRGLVTDRMSAGKLSQLYWRISTIFKIQ